MAYPGGVVSVRVPAVVRRPPARWGRTGRVLGWAAVWLTGVVVFVVAVCLRVPVPSSLVLGVMGGMLVLGVLSPRLA